MTAICCPRSSVLLGAGELFPADPLESLTRWWPTSEGASPSSRAGARTGRATALQTSWPRVPGRTSVAGRTSGSLVAAGGGEAVQVL